MMFTFTTQLRSDIKFLVQSYNKDLFHLGIKLDKTLQTVTSTMTIIMIHYCQPVAMFSWYTALPLETI